MASQAFLGKMQQRQNFRNLWHTDLVHTIQDDTPFCWLAFWCGPGVSYLLRKRALYNDMSRYVCCAGYMPCSGRCGESKCPEFCLCTEHVVCCSLVFLGVMARGSFSRAHEEARCRDGVV